MNEKDFLGKKKKKKVETIECISNLWSGQVCGSFMVPRYQNGVRGHWRSNSAQSSEVEVTVQYFLPVSSTLLLQAVVSMSTSTPGSNPGHLTTLQALDGSMPSVTS